MIRHIPIHHSGGFQVNPLASTRHLTFEDINNAHMHRPDWIGYRAHKSSMGFYLGYTWYYDVVARTFTQARAIGEETLATRGFNFNSAPVCVGGNYSLIPNTQLTVDLMNQYMEKDIAKHVLDLISGNHNWVVAPGAKLDFSITRVHPHRWYQRGTECYGSGLTDKWITGILSEYSLNNNTQRLERRRYLMQRLIDLYMQIIAFYEKKQNVKAMSLASMYEPSCTGIVY